MRTTPFPPRAPITAAEKAAVIRLFDHAIATGEEIRYGGPELDAYCAEFSNAMGGGRAHGVSSGTAAVFVALRALEFEPFGEVVTGPITDPGGVMPIALCNCVPVIADAAPGSYNTGPEQVEACISKLTRAIVVPHVGGEPADVAAISALAGRRGIPLIEDCAQAHAARLDSRPLGAFGLLATFSTMYAKHHHTGGQGGIVFTRDRSTFERVRRHTDRGKPFGLPPGSTPAVAALNFNMDELQAAIGRVQLSRLGENVAARRRIASAIAAAAADATFEAISMPAQLPGADPSYWFLRLHYDSKAMTCSRTEFCAALAAEGIPVRGDPLMPHTNSWFRERHVFGSSLYPWGAPAYRGDRERAFPCPNARAAVNDHFSVSINERWGEREVADTVEALAKLASAYRC